MRAFGDVLRNWGFRAFPGFRFSNRLNKDDRGAEEVDILAKEEQNTARNP